MITLPVIMESDSMPPTLLHYICLALGSYYQVTIISWYMFKESLSMSRPFVVVLTFYVSHPYVSCTWWFYLFTSCLSVCFMSIDEGYIKALLRQISLYRLQHIIYKRDLETNYYLRACSPKWFLELVVGFLIDWF
jgi:hypothetical protein